MISLGRNRSQTVEVDLDAGLAETVRTLKAAYTAPVPALVFDPSAEELASPSPVRHRRWKPAVALVAVAMAVAAGFAVPVLRDGAEPVSAQEILARAVAATGPDSSYHQVVVTTTTSATRIGNGDPVTRFHRQRVEVWYRDPEHARLEIRNVDESGKPGTLLSGYIRDGDDVWQVSEDGGTDGGAVFLRVSHGSVRSALGVFFGKGVFTPPSDLKSALQNYWSNCPAPSLRGDGKVVGRAAYVVDVCGPTVWIDKQIYLVLRTEVKPSIPATPVPCGTDTGSCSHYSLGSAEVAVLESPAVIPDAVFAFQPPPGVFVSEQPDLP